ncbi:MAG: hypothetical protein AAF745_13120, partial [Planctomycetota bacterium]
GRLQNAESRTDLDASDPDHALRRFIKIKKAIATALVPVLLTMAVWSFLVWMFEVLSADGHPTDKFKDINKIFFEDFFKMLIIIDVLLLLISFFHTDQFHKTIRNSGFVISTILIRLSFAVEGLVSTALVIVAVVFGLAVLWVHNCYAGLSTVAVPTNVNASTNLASTELSGQENQ